MLLDCPFCGPRELDEFRFRTAETDAASPRSAYALVYERDNVSGSSREYWQHERGCRAWLVVQRNPSTAEILDVQLLARPRTPVP
jgi:sarcosine oxidase subunit delta